jgi:hypothetical protein
MQNQPTEMELLSPKIFGGNFAERIGQIAVSAIPAAEMALILIIGE